MDAAGTAATFCSGGQTGGRRRSYNLQPGHGKHAAAAAAHAAQQSTCVAVRLRAAMDDMARFASSSPPAIELAHSMSTSFASAQGHTEREGTDFQHRQGLKALSPNVRWGD
ncbi:hypothetical protein MY8738_005262 [Beauveria namnaoensis]